jgi:hypothetical protein
MELPPGKVARVIAPLMNVTPLSKYLALALVITLPFIGGWIGYTVAPVPVVESQPVAQTVSPVAWEASPEAISAAPLLFPLDADTEIALLYQATTNGTWYFQTLTDSSQPSRVVAYDSNERAFRETDLFVDYAGGDTVSDSGRYVANVTDYLSPTTSLAVFDLETWTIVDTITLGPTETLIAGSCGYAGPTFSITWTETESLRYGVFSMASYLERGCDNELIEYREQRY